ncbi:hypothetical protein [Streptomyces sp. NPDC058299]|uniref:hypothetical protein n=1 Tax=unclassified Streptomyces TaxID=2593676 RepID=UPI0036E76508
MEQLSAGKKLDRAFDKLGKKHTLSFEFDLDTDAASLKALDAKSHPAPGDEMPDDAAKLLSDAKIAVTVESKKPLDESGDKDLVGMAMKISGPDGALAEYRVIGDYAYLRADFKTIGKLTGSPVPGAEDLPPQAGALKNVFAGKWVKFDAKETQKAAAGGRDSHGSPAPGPSLDAATQKKLVAAVREVVARDVHLKTAGGGDGTEHITATAPFRTLVSELLGKVRPLLAKDLPQGMELPTAKDLKDAPDTKVTADFTLKNGDLTEVDVDLAKLAETAKVKKLGLRVRLGEGTRPTVPAGATKLDLKALMQGFFAGAPTSDSSFAESDLSDLDAS